jgi:D-alanyl-D-alanine carboxypeptidase
MRLSGLLSNHYEVYYRLHKSGSGWLDWASSTHPTGTIGVDTSFDAIEVTLLPRTTAFIGNIRNPFTENYQAKPGLIYYTTQNLGLYTDKRISNKILNIPSSTYLTGVEDGEFLKTEYQGITGYVHKATLSRHTVTLYKNVILVNKKHSLPSSFNPGINADANTALSRMVAAAAKEGIYLQAISAYRSYQYQHDLFNRYVKSHGRTEAERFSMRAGHSEHQTGQAFDLGKRGGGSALSQSFGRTPEGLWLAKNAPYYGFVLRYPEGKEHITGIKYEPWHFRYVGSELAVKITNSGKTMDEFFQAVAPTY